MVREQKWRPGSKPWDTIKQHSQRVEARVTIVGIRQAEPGKPVSTSGTTILTAREEVGAPIFYRDVPLPFIYAVKNPETIRWRLGDIGAAKEPPVVLEDLPVCGNCHSFSRDGKTLGMDVDYANEKGSYAITAVERETVLSTNKIITWDDYRREDGDLTFGLLAQLSPDGRYAICTVKDRSVFVPKDDLAYSQLFFPIKGILVVYDRETKEFFSLRGADDSRYVQSNPTWIPDGKSIIFARAPTQEIPGAEKVTDVLLPVHLVQDFVEGRRGFRFDLYRVPFNGGQGGTAEPIPGASGNGMSNYFGRVSPDGKWLVFTQAKNFMLLQPDSRLYIMPVEGGEPREMTCNTARMNSWHSWSPNGRWLVFASKARGPYTQLYLTHVDEQGRDHPAVLLEHLSLEKRAANIPEFVNAAPGAIERIVEDFVNDHNLVRQADWLSQKTREYAKSLKYYRSAVKLNPRNLDARVHLGVSLAMLGQNRAAEQEFKNALERDPACVSALSNLATLYFRTNRLAEARRMYETILGIEPEDADAHLNLGVVYYRSGDAREAEAMFRKVVSLDPDQPKAQLNLGYLLDARGREREAMEHYRAALRYAPKRLEGCLYVAQALIRKKELAPDLARLLGDLAREQPDLTQCFLLLADLHQRQGRLDEALEALERAQKTEHPPDWIGARIAELKAQKRRARNRER